LNQSLIYLHFFEPEWFVEQFDSLLEIFRSKKIGFINLPIQSGSDKILKLMNRPYKIDEVVGKVTNEGVLRINKDKLKDNEVLGLLHENYIFDGCELSKINS